MDAFIYIIVAGCVLHNCTVLWQGVYRNIEKVTFAVEINYSSDILILCIASHCPSGSLQAAQNPWEEL